LKFFTNGTEPAEAIGIIADSLPPLNADGVHRFKVLSGFIELMAERNDEFLMWDGAVPSEEAVFEEFFDSERKFLWLEMNPRVVGFDAELFESRIVNKRGKGVGNRISDDPVVGFPMGKLIQLIERVGEGVHSGCFYRGDILVSGFDRFMESRKSGRFF